MFPKLKVVSETLYRYDFPRQGGCYLRREPGFLHDLDSVFLVLRVNEAETEFLCGGIDNVLEFEHFEHRRGNDLLFHGLFHDLLNCL